MTQQVSQVSHPVTGAGASDLGLALDVASALHPPVTAARPSEVAVPELMGLRTGTARPHRRKVPLNRLTALRG
ncbi:hypothetical protein [Streptomyces antibioticus]|uniref:hypothetical protein n=1 Tax=Streptomyces antibioticus TaxID=1890 RepID=UPI0004CB484A|nr:hypothetical protein [Streptomyces antibioticus]MCX4738249.1 hypothetical protein [Streptomyces antibioticus]MCX5169968.1 hypothetical protein [Streptomyces antibioticus]